MGTGQFGGALGGGTEGGIVQRGGEIRFFCGTFGVETGGLGGVEVAEEGSLGSVGASRVVGEGGPSVP